MSAAVALPAWSGERSRQAPHKPRGDFRVVAFGEKVERLGSFMISVLPCTSMLRSSPALRFSSSRIADGDLLFLRRFHTRNPTTVRRMGMICHMVIDGA